MSYPHREGQRMATVIRTVKKHRPGKPKCWELDDLDEILDCCVECLESFGDLVFDLHAPYAIEDNGDNIFKASYRCDCGNKWITCSTEQVSTV